MYIKSLLYFFLSTIICGVICSCSASTSRNLIFSCEENNDLYQAAKASGMQSIRFDNAEKAAEAASQDDAVLILADEYPEQPVPLTENFFRLVKEKKLRVYLEYPSYLPGLSINEAVDTDLERAVVNSSFFNGIPDSLKILSISGLHYLPLQVDKAHIVAARVAGFDHAVYGLPEKNAPLLFELPDAPILVATTNLSQFISGRYAPQQAWGNVWEAIFQYLQPNKKTEQLTWQPVISAFYEKDENLPDDYQKASIQKGIQWYINAKMLVPSSYEDTLQRMIESGNERLKWSADIPAGDGSHGAFEAVMSTIDAEGNQPIGIIKRGDCISETAMAFASAGTVLKNADYFNIAEHLLDFYLLHSSATQNEYGNPQHGAYGLIPWGISNTAWYKASYGDDNARVLLSALTTAALTDTDRWNATLMKSLVALLRTTGKNGFRGNRIDLQDFEKNGWQHYYHRDIINMAPHFEAYLWACFLWAYQQTGDPLFLERTQQAIKTTMEGYSDEWTWTNGIAQEKARMILPLAWLLRIQDTPENREMLYTVLDDLLALQHETGAIREAFGNLEKGKYPPPQSNEAYGTNEASLIAENGDPVSDLLYTTNFAFLGLHETAYATDDPKIKAAVDRLAAFLCRIQVKSEGHPEIHGGWMRAFDFERHEHWGSNADHGWGAWAIESGWTQGWITSVLALREMNTSIWDLTQPSDIEKYYADLKQQMLLAKPDK